MAAATTIAFVDPARVGRFPVQLGPSLRGQREPDQRFYTVRYELKPRQKRDSKRTATIAPEPSGQGDFTLTITDTEPDDASQPEQRHTYAGRREDAAASCVLTFDRSAQRFTLDALDGAYAFDVMGASKQSQDGVPRPSSDAQLAEIAPTPRPQQDNTVTPAAVEQGVQSGDRGEDQDLFDFEDNPADSSNPFDFRHYVEALPAVLHPESGHFTSSPRQTPTGTPFHGSGTQALDPATIASPLLPTPESRRTQDGSGGMKRKPRPTPTVLRPPKKSRRIPSATMPQYANSRGEQGTPGQRSQPIPSVRVHRASINKPSSASPGTDDDVLNLDGGLELIIEGEDEGTPWNRQRTTPVLFSDRPAAGYISLREAASRSQSPSIAVGKAQSRMNRSRHHSEHDGSDHDVDDLRLGSPGYALKSPTRSVASERSEESDRDEDDGDDEFQRAMQEAIEASAAEGASDEDEPATAAQAARNALPVGSTQQEDEESEEE